MSGTHPQVQATVNQEAGVSDVASGECGCRCHHVVHEFELFLLVSLMISVVSGTPLTVNLQEAGVSNVASSMPGECGCHCPHAVHEFELFYTSPS